MLNSKRQDSVQGPKGVRALGVLPRLLRHDTLSVLEEAREGYGDLFKLRVGPASLVIASHPEHARHILQTASANYTKGRVYDPGRRWMIGDGLIASTGDFWLRQRRMMQPHFHRQQLAGLTTLMTDAIGEALASWEPREEGATLHLDKATARLSIKVITRTLFGSGKLSEAEMDEVGAAFLTLMRQLTPRLFLYFLPKQLPLPGDRALRRVRRTVDAAIYKLIAERRRTPGGNDLLAMLMGAADGEGAGEGRSMSDAQLRNEVATLFIAGYDTVSTGLTWTWHLLSEHPRALARLEEEIETALGKRTPTFADLGALPYTRNVLRESLRVRPPVGMVPRTLKADDELDGHLLREGTTVWLYIYGVHHHVDFWDAPEDFVPERFESDQKHRFAYLPFIVGPRQCIGNEFAMMEMALALVMTIQRYEVTALNDPPALPLLTTVLKPRYGVQARVRSRA